MYPKYADINGEKIPLNTGYKNALKCLEVINDFTISDLERTLALIYLMFGYIPDDELIEAYLEKAVLFLQCGKTTEEQGSHEADMDLIYDRKYINASFMQVYRIDLDKTDLHFWQFIEYIEGLPSDCALSKVREIRSCDVKDYAEKDRAEIRRLKRELALPKRLSREEQELDDEFERLFEG